MANHTKDWRETDRDLSELPDAQLRRALEDAGVKAVLPSHKKPRGLFKPVGRMGDATGRWAAGDWEERISLDDLPDAQKFLQDPLKPPTTAVPQQSAPSTRPRGASPVRGIVLGLLATAAVAGLGVFALRESRLLEGPQVQARSTPPAVAAAPAADEPSALDTPAAEAPALSAPAGSQAHDEAQAKEQDARLKELTEKAEDGEVPAMIALAKARLKEGDAEDSMKWAARAKKADRRSIEARIVLGDAQMLAGYGKAAQQTWRGALARSPQNEALRRRLAEW